MKSLYSIIAFFSLFVLNAQHTISGNFHPAKDFRWLMAYELTSGGQRYVTNTAVKNGYFKMKLPTNAVKGTYRLVYAVPQDECYIDVLYNGQEDIELNFDLEEGVHFVKSEENKLLNDYFTKISTVENKLFDFYQNGKTAKNEFMAITKELSDTQSTMEAIQKQSMAHQFIVSNKPYVPDGFESVETYLSNKKLHYFDAIDMNNGVLQASNFLSDKITHYVFSALSPDLASQAAMEAEINTNVDTVKEKAGTTPEDFQIAIFYTLWKLANDNNLNNVADYIYASNLKNLALKAGKHEMANEIETTTRLRMGEKSPEITWEKNGVTKTLSGLETADHYILIFWSSTCSHCLTELPPLHKELQKRQNIKVVAIGLESDQENWVKESAKFPFFEHAIALKKWESEYAKLFAVHKTPTYFILDRDKRFTAKPESDKEVVAYLENK
ncbi:TlpA family protein disulfide reductase [Maribacter sp. 2304DJ31-5]|uniref:TlpA family protein disulfide reductase n=1 Tax=Maribacter sp. 2304DJ31-5 TaxID=3386273 RepID=UPI0039BD79DF